MAVVNPAAYDESGHGVILVERAMIGIRQMFSCGSHAAMHARLALC